MTSSEEHSSIIKKSSVNDEDFETPSSTSSKSLMRSRSATTNNRVVTPNENITGSNVLHGLQEYEYIPTMFSNINAKENVQNFHVLLEALKPYFQKKKLPLQTLYEKKQNKIVGNETINQLFGAEKGSQSINTIRDILNTLCPAVVCK